MKKYKVVNILWPQKTIFVGESWQCREYIESNFGNGFKATIHQIVEIYVDDEHQKEIERMSNNWTSGQGFI